MVRWGRKKNRRELAVALTIALVAAGIVSLVVSAFTDLDRSAAWSDIIGAVAGVATLLLAFADRIPFLRADKNQSTAEVADRLAALLLREHKRQLSELIGTNVPESNPAMVRFRRQARTKSRSPQENTHSVIDLAHFYLEHANSRLVIMGGPGAGKTVAAMLLMVDLLKARTTRVENEATKAPPVPVLFSLPSWDGELSLERWLADTLSRRYSLSPNQAGALVSGGLILPILDDLDGLYAIDSEGRRGRVAVNALNRYLASAIDASVVVICRSDGRHQRLAAEVRHATRVLLEPLSPVDIRAYIEDHCSDQLSRSEWQPVLAKLRGRPSSRLLSALNSPWRLTAAMTFYRCGGDPSELLPGPAEQRGSAAPYAYRVKHLLAGSFVKGRAEVHPHPVYTADFARRALAVVAAHLDNLARAGGSATDVNLHEWWMGSSARAIRRRHALYAYSIAGVILCGSWNIDAVRAGIGDDWRDALGVFATALMFRFLIMGAVQEDKPPVVASLAVLKTSTRARWTLLGGATLAAFVAIAGANAYGLPYALLLTFATLVTTLLVVSRIPAEALVMDPRAVIRRDFGYHLVSGIALGAMMTIFYSKIYNVPLALTIGIANTIGWILASATARYIFALQAKCSFRLGAFLGWAHSAGLLRVSGISYQFRHAELQEWSLHLQTASNGRSALSRKKQDQHRVDVLEQALSDRRPGPVPKPHSAEVSVR